LDVEIAEGWLGVQPTGDVPPLLVGRFASPMLSSELDWGIDEGAEGQRVLCIEIPKKHQSARAIGATCDCIFDESLHVNGEPCLEPGLSQGTITVQMPPTCPTSSDT
jgi:hypothetical protein